MTPPEDKIPWIRTPLIRSQELSKLANCNVYLKLENVQPSGSFKSRGIGNFLLAALRRHHASTNFHSNSNTNSNSPPSPVHFYSSSGGNAGLGCVHAAVTLGCKATIVVPLSTTEFMIKKLRVAGAEEIIQHGESWKEADQYLREVVIGELEKKKKKDRTAREGEVAIYVPPFDAQDIWDGVSTIIPEIVEGLADAQKHYKSESAADAAEVDGAVVVPQPDLIICSVGGGGLFAGIMQGLDSSHLSPTTQVLALETLGADSLAQSVRQGGLVTLPAITSIATSLGARTVCAKALEYALRDHQVVTHVVSDKEAIEACRRFAEEQRVLVEPACGVCLTPIYDGSLGTGRLVQGLGRGSNVVVVVCGGSNVSFELLGGYLDKFSSGTLET